MDLASQILLIVDAVALVVQLVFGGWFLWKLWKSKPAPATHAQLPKTAIHLPIKGLDPELKECLLSLLRQDYPNYELHIVMHSDDDPAWPIVQAAIEETGATNVRIETFRSEFDPLQLRCTNAKTVQGAAGLDESFEYIVTTVGALTAHPSWLRELLAPMIDDASVGATFGNRWFMPRGAEWGSLMRHLWMVASVPIMYFGNMPWGGSLATRMSAVRKPGLLDEWARTLAIDAATPRQMAEQGLKVRFVPNLIMVNRDDCDVPFYMNFVQRQLTWIRVYHAHWPAVVLHAAVYGLWLLATVGIIAAAAIRGDFRTALIVAAAFLIFQASLLGFVVAADYVIRKSSTSFRHDPVGWLSWKAVLRLPWALFLTQLSHPVTVWRAAFQKQVVWRGLTLEIVGPNDIRNPNAVAANSARDRLTSNTG